MSKNIIIIVIIVAIMKKQDFRIQNYYKKFITAVIDYF